jgi:hypothetical protein
MRWPYDIKLREQANRVQAAGRGLLAAGWRFGVRVWPFTKSKLPELSAETPVVAPVEGSPPLEAENLIGLLGAEKDFLLELVHGMEKEFLATGGGLMRLAQQLTEIRKQCQALTDLTLGQTQDAAVQFAFQLLKKSEDLVLASYDQYDHVFATFRELQQRLAQLARQHEQLMRVLLPLNFITISFRIEASRHPEEVQQAFFTLADNVNRTVNEVRATMGRQFAELAASERIALKVMKQIATSIQKHRQEVTTTLETSRNQLRALSNALTISGAGASDLAQLNQAVNRHIGSIVMAQQCQDITRQRIEHVGAAMDEMRLYLDEAGPVTAATDADTHHFVFRAGQIQLHQVQNVFDQLNRAADNLKSGIHSLRSEAGTAAEVAVKVGSTSLDASVARQCQAGIGEILGIVKQAVQKIGDIIAAFAPLQASFVDCTSKASALAGEVRRAGLNAQVFAIHAPDGATLEVLAGRVRLISEEVIQQVELMGASLNHTTELVNNLRQRLEDFQILGQAEQEVLAREAQLSQEKLMALERAIPLLIRQVTQHQGTFAQSVEAILVEVKFPAAVAAASVRSIGFFRELVAWGNEGSARFSVATAASEKIDLLQSKYTMESERLAHAAAFQPVLAVAAANAPESAFEMFEDFSAPATAVADAPGEIFSLSEISPKGKLAHCAPEPERRLQAAGRAVPQDHLLPPEGGVPTEANCEAAETPSRPADPATSKPRPPAPVPALAAKPTAKEDLGDNVDLF